MKLLGNFSQKNDDNANFSLAKIDEAALAE